MPTHNDVGKVNRTGIDGECTGCRDGLIPRDITEIPITSSGYGNAGGEGEVANWRAISADITQGNGAIARREGDIGGAKERAK